MKAASESRLKLNSEVNDGSKPSKVSAPPIITTLVKHSFINGSYKTAVAKFERGPIQIYAIYPLNFKALSTINLYAF